MRNNERLTRRKNDADRKKSVKSRKKMRGQRRSREKPKESFVWRRNGLNKRKSRTSVSSTRK